MTATVDTHENGHRSVCHAHDVTGESRKTWIDARLDALLHDIQFHRRKFPTEWPL